MHTIFKSDRYVAVTKYPAVMNTSWPFSHTVNDPIPCITYHLKFKGQIFYTWYFIYIFQYKQNCALLQLVFKEWLLNCVHYLLHCMCIQQVLLCYMCKVVNTYFLKSCNDNYSVYNLSKCYLWWYRSTINLRIYLWFVLINCLCIYLYAMKKQHKCNI